MKRMGLLVAIGILAGSIIIGGNASAQSINRTAQIAQQRCEQIRAIAPTGDRAKEMQEKREQVYEKANALLAKYAESSKKALYNYESLTDAQKALEEAHTTYADASNAYQEKLAAIQNMECGDNGTGYTEPLKEARTALKSVREANQSLKTTIQETVIPALRDYATWIQAIKSSDTAE